ncbi:MAG: YqgE/AlgH family protein [Chitinophagaceae bacterium]|nr:YqgE/AlgH family protein [Chitinophagaceae bacterium]MCW5905398.1 YqgE/AlgH family protein [Chitinophagaceae bacterium]
MNHLLGKILVSSPTIGDENFKNTILFIVEHNEKGAIGFVINKIFEHSLNELTEFSHIRSFPLYKGGPVDKEHLFFIHCKNNLIDNGSLIMDNIYFGGNFNQVITEINNKNVSTMDIKIFIGYCGWNANELETEIAEGSWLVFDSSIEMVFAQNPDLFI